MRDTPPPSASTDALRWAERPVGELLRLSWPIALSMLSYSLMTVVDTLLVSRLGAAELAGVGLAGTVSFALLCFPMGLLRATKVLISQSVGAGRTAECSAHLRAGLMVGLGMGLVMALIGGAAAEGLKLIAATPASGQSGAVYLRIRSLAAPLALTYVALREACYGQGDARSPLIATLAANLLNAALACFFLLRLGWGVAGAAWAAVISQGVEAALLGHLRGIPRSGRVHAEHLRALWKVGLPTGVQFLLEIGAFTLLAALIAALSEAEMAAHQIALQVIHVSFLPAYAMSEGASVLVGQAVGADRDGLVRRVARHALAGSLVYTLACTLGFALFAPWIVAAFRPAAGVATVAVRLLYVAAVFQVFDGANMVARGALRGTGDVRYAAVVGVVCSWLLTPPLTWLLGYRLQLGALGGWIGLSAEIIIGAIVLWHRLERGMWREAAMRSRAALVGAAVV
ncbi:MAG: MATE family efflux transporter [Myxococcales bacterium]|nr:MATE family efflux transporter [Myxococcota bacterium]MDW8282600.1 MATE family efflux transporter [Myxococcales bacterium]